MRWKYLCSHIKMDVPLNQLHGEICYKVTLVQSKPSFKHVHHYMYDVFFVKYVYSFKTVYDVQIILQSGRHKTCLIAFLGVKHFIWQNKLRDIIYIISFSVTIYAISVLISQPHGTLRFVLLFHVLFCSNTRLVYSDVCFELVFRIFHFFILSSLLF